MSIPVIVVATWANVSLRRRPHRLHHFQLLAQLGGDRRPGVDRLETLVESLGAHRVEELVRLLRPEHRVVELTANVVNPDLHPGDTGVAGQVTRGFTQSVTCRQSRGHVAEVLLVEHGEVAVELRCQQRTDQLGVTEMEDHRGDPRRDPGGDGPRQRHDAGQQPECCQRSPGDEAGGRDGRLGQDPAPANPGVVAEDGGESLAQKFEMTDWKTRSMVSGSVAR